MAHENYKNMMKDLTQIMGNGELDSNQLTQMCKSIFKKEFKHYPPQYYIINTYKYKVHIFNIT